MLHAAAVIVVTVSRGPRGSVDTTTDTYHCHCAGPVEAESLWTDTVDCGVTSVESCLFAF